MKRGLLATLGFVALTCAYTWPLPLQMRSAVVHDLGDPLLVTWLIWWSTHVTPLTAGWWSAPAFYPATGVFAFSENMLGLAPITWPILLLTKTPLLAYNVAFLLSFVLSGLGAYFLGFVLTRRHDAAFIGGIAFAFAPYRLSHTHHLQLLSCYWMPVALASLHLYLDTLRRRWALLFAASWLLQALACGYYFFYLTLLALLWLAWFVPVRDWSRYGPRLAIAWVAAAVLLAPVLLGYRAIQSDYGFKRSPVEIVNYSADIAGLWSASPDSLMWSRLHAGVSSESEQFPGLMILLLFVSGVVVAVQAAGAPRPVVSASPVVSAFRRNETGAGLLFYSLTAVLMWMLSLGPRPALNGVPIGVPGPYALLALLPGFDGMRVPARFWMLAVLCLSVTAAIAIARIQTPRTRRWVAALATLALLIEGWPHALALRSVPPMRVTTTNARARLVLPMRQNETEAMYGAIAQARPVFNGYSGYTAPQHAALLELLEHYDRDILKRVAATEPIEVVVEAIGDPEGVWTAYVRGHPGATRVDIADGWTSYLLPVSGAVAAPPYRGEPIKVAAVNASVNAHDIGAVLDGDINSRWHTPRQEGSETITVDVGSPQRVGALEMSLGAYPGQFPRRLSIDVSGDGAAWTTVYTGGTALPTYDAAVQAPRDVPLTFMIQRDAVRLLRLRQTAADSHGWSIVELRVLR
jgi:hypothetical protein